MDTPQKADEPGDIRTFKLKMLMRQEFEKNNDQISFDAFTSAVKTRKALASTFYHLLLLGSAGQIKFSQAQAYGDIVVTKQVSF